MCKNYLRVISGKGRQNRLHIPLWLIVAKLSAGDIIMDLSAIVLFPLMLWARTRTQCVKLTVLTGN